MLDNHLNHFNTVAIFGEWNTQNLGDKAIGANASQFFLDLGYQVKLFNFGSFSYQGHVKSENDIEKYFLKEESPPPVSLSKQYKVSFLKKILPAFFFTFFKNCIRFFRHLKSMKKLANQMRDCKFIVVGGGALLENVSFHFTISMLSLLTLKRWTKKDFYCLGCSSSSKYDWFSGYITKKFLESAKLVAVRDENTAQMLFENFGRQFPIFGDFALDLNHIYYRKQENLKINHKNEVRVAINLMRYIGEYKEKQEMYERHLCEMIEHLLYDQRVEKKFVVSLFTTGDDGDYELVKKIGQRYGLQTFNPKSLGMLNEIYEKHDVVVASRLHATILAFSAGSIVIGIGLQGKKRGFFKNIGLESYCVDFWRNETVNDMLCLFYNLDILASQYEQIQLETLFKQKNNIIKILQTHQS
ncbi:polysaccharide pyruvyl transferase family protein [Thermoflexibacter ruber]|uniref:Polysaccharide pyruvyl transferase family protein WcaK n=1 Tax=Thermoflexibacter ruber TaxID=1003 RepID=A0A1I2DU29_9BACT|nr:polysaccharide pyruvyl transferase family protein [Thermoflexibacter ruber]SFE84075.1 Polysaccharide pyruvyl transferase family protein WcaK [Thermoflexibacter ruber]